MKTSLQIFEALQAGEISLEEAKQKLGHSISKGDPVSATRQLESVEPEATTASPDPAPTRSAEGDRRQDRFERDPMLEGIAVIGMAGQFPKSEHLEAFWENLAAGKSCISEVPKERWPVDDYFDPDPNKPGKTYSKWLGALDSVDKFDPLFFNISPVEAELIDPQQRLFLENCWACVEDAGLSQVISGSHCGVFVGVGHGDYGEGPESGELNAQALLGNSSSILSSRISYLLNLKGPCLAIDTACSSSLVAISEACNSLALGTCEMALAGGVSTLSSPKLHIMTSKAGMLSPDGKCYTFDDRAHGYVPGEGVGVVLLKRLADARRDGDVIHGIIRGWGVNQDGKTNGITAPSGRSQTNLECHVYERFQIEPESITMVEAHGTGTKLGDPIEVEALIDAFTQFTGKKNYCALGSVKSNIGHLLTAAGISGVMKVLLSLRNRMIPPTIHFESLNEHIQLQNSPFFINQSLRPWRVEGHKPRRACVSSFGMSGTNGHLVIEEAPTTEKVCPPSDYPVLLVLSAKHTDALHNYVMRMLAYLKQCPEDELVDTTFTLQTGRKPMALRLAIWGQGRDGLVAELEAFLAGRKGGSSFFAEEKKHRREIAKFKVEEDAGNLVARWVDEKNLEKLGRFWAKGLPIDWQACHNHWAGKGSTYRPRRKSLPTYPFLRHRYWLPKSASPTKTATMSEHGVAGPLLQAKGTPPQAQVFYSNFRGSEWFLADHQVAGHRVLPGSVYLEMACEAIRATYAEFAPSGQDAMVLKGVTWMEPWMLNTNQTGGDKPSLLRTRLMPSQSAIQPSSSDFVIDSQADFPTLDGGNPKPHCQGKVFIQEQLDTPSSVPLADLCDSAEKFTGSTCYQAFLSMGVNYGPTFQLIQERDHPFA